MNYHESTAANTDGTQAGARPDQSEQEEKCRRATFVERADNAVAGLKELATNAKDAFFRRSKQALLTAVCLIYGAICEIENANGGAQFLADRGVVPHGNSENPQQPLVLAFTKDAGGWARSGVCKYAQVIAVARHHQIAPDDFEAWFSTRTIGDARAEYRRITTERRKMLREALIAKILINPEKEPEKAPILPGTSVTKGHTGLKLLVVNVLDDVSGNYRELGMLPHAPEEVMEIVEAAAKKAASFDDQQ
jgi:hypothetical protein